MLSPWWNGREVLVGTTEGGTARSRGVKKLGLVSHTSASFLEFHRAGGDRQTLHGSARVAPGEGFHCFMGERAPRTLFCLIAEVNVIAQNPQIRERGEVQESWPCPMSLHAVTQKELDHVAREILMK